MKYLAHGHVKKTHVLGLPDDTPKQLGYVRVAHSFEERFGRLPDAVAVDGQPPVAVGRCASCRAIVIEGESNPCHKCRRAAGSPS